MSPTTGGRPGQRPGGIAAFAPIIVAVCAIVLVREGVEAVFPDLNTWIAFVVALVVGWLAYTGVERLYTRRNRDTDGPGARRPGDDA
jgi:uncharacterized membrane protein YccC